MTSPPTTFSLTPSTPPIPPAPVAGPTSHAPVTSPTALRRSQESQRIAQLHLALFPAPGIPDASNTTGDGSPDTSTLSFAAAAACADDLSSTDPCTWADALASPHAKEWRTGYLNNLASI
jgi:hypothetical protein